MTPAPWIGRRSVLLPAVLTLAGALLGCAPPTSYDVPAPASVPESSFFYIHVRNLDYLTVEVDIDDAGWCRLGTVFPGDDRTFVIDRGQFGDRIRAVVSNNGVVLDETIAYDDLLWEIP